MFQRFVNKSSMPKILFSLGLILFVMLPTACSLLPESLFQEQMNVHIILEANGNVEDDVLQQTRDLIETRIKGLDLSEIDDLSVQIAGDQIVINFAIVEEATAELVLNAVSSIGLLEFVDFAGIPESIGEGDCIFTTEQATMLVVIREQLNDKNAQLWSHCIPIGTDGQPYGSPFVTVMTGSGLEDAQAQIQPNGTRWEIAFSLNDEGNERFGNHTDANIGQRMAIVLDGVVLSAPIINGRIVGEGVISGTFTEDEAKVLATQLRYGLLSIPLEVVAYDVTTGE